MEKYESEINTLNLFKEGKITEYAFQQEFSNFVGPMAEVHLAPSSGKNTASSYGIFVYPERHVNGIKIIYLIDKDVITNNFYTSKELVERLLILAQYKQSIIKEFVKFLKEYNDKALSLGMAVAQFLRIYNSILEILSITGKDFLPDSIKLTELIISLSDGRDVESTIEKLVIDNILPKDVLSLAEDLIHDSPEGEIITNIKFVTDGRELPAINLGQQMIRDLCSSTYGTREHKEIKYDYKPATNQ